MMASLLTSLKNVFVRERDYPVETFGKLIFYKDYISVVLTEGAVQWRTWLLESFQGKFMPPDGLWYFMYQHRQDADLVIGLIRASSDGLRPFPFSLFTVCRRGRGKGGLCTRPIAVSLWQQLEGMHQQVVRSVDIQAFYAQVYGKKISLPAGMDCDIAGDHEFSCSREGDWPRMLVAATRDARMLHCVKDGMTTNEEFAQNWQGLITTDAFVQRPSYS